jgi:hypothetical protein
VLDLLSDTELTPSDKVPVVFRIHPYRLVNSVHLRDALSRAMRMRVSTTDPEIKAKEKVGPAAMSERIIVCLDH